MKRILLTGASGFIGRHVIAGLQGGGHEVTAVTRDIQKLEGVPGIDRIIELDLASPPKQIYAALGRPDILIHLSWDGLPNYKSLYHFETEVPRQYAFLKSLVQAGLPRVVIAGTCLEYGLQSGPLSESLPTRPVTAYGLAKDILRRQLEALRLNSPFALAWCRLFYMYGTGQAGGSLFTLLKAAVERGDAVFPMSGGEQLRDYLPVERLAEYLTKIALTEEATGIINVCSGHPTSVRGQVETWLRDFDWRIDLELGRLSYPDYEPMAFWGDTNRLVALLK
jgi:dTDP-6-deoxy-L-talose 4-dehydrogenase (NAD+)